MPLTVTVGLIVLAVMAIVAMTAHLIDESAERHERTSDSRDRRA